MLQVLGLQKGIPNMSKWTMNVRALVRDESGQDLIEYALLATFVALVTILGATALGTSLNNWYSTAGSNVNSHAGTVGR